MKKTKLINAEISRIISLLGHTDEIAIGDMGLPIPDHVERIDLAVQKGTPSLKEVLDVILTEMYVERYTIAQEAMSDFDQLCQRSFLAEQDLPNKEVVSHKDFKKKLDHVKVVIRTGEALPYYNIILSSGVTF